MSVFLQPIYTQTLASPASTILFNNIPQGYTDLVVEISARSDTSDGIEWRTLLGYINGNTSSMYGTMYMLGNGTGTGSNGSADGGTGAFGWITGSLNKANTFSNTRLTFPNYASGLNKIVVTDSICESDTSYALNMLSMVSMNEYTAPITSIGLVQSSGNFIAGSTFTVYGRSVVYDTAAPVAPTLGAITNNGGIVSVAFTPAAGSQADSYFVDSPASLSTPVYGTQSPISISIPANYNAAIQVGSTNGLGTAYSGYSSPAVVTDNNFSSIYTAVASTNGAGFQFNNIPTYYRHLQVRIYGRAFSAVNDAPVLLQFNTDTNAIYAWHYFGNNNATGPFQGSYTSQNVIEMQRIPGNTAGAGLFSPVIFDILDYANSTKTKTVRYIGGFNNNGAGQVYISSGLYPYQTNVSSITISTYGGFMQGSIAALYGMSV